VHALVEKSSLEDLRLWERRARGLPVTRGGETERPVERQIGMTTHGGFHESIKRAAEARGASLNSFCDSVLATGLAELDLQIRSSGSGAIDKLQGMGPANAAHAAVEDSVKWNVRVSREVKTRLLLLSREFGMPVARAASLLLAHQLLR
jgi:hypothetical protein